MSYDAPGLVLRRLEGIEAELAHKQNDYEEAAGEYARAKRDWELSFAKALVKSTQGSDERRKAEARIAADTECGLVFAEATGRWEGLKGSVRALEARATVGQSILRAHTREAFGSNSAVAPAWSSKGGQ